MCPRNLFQVASRNTDFEIKTDIEITVRTAVTTMSDGNGQGYLELTLVA